MSGDKGHENCFDLQKDTATWIYGAGNKGRTIADRLMDAGYHVAGFLDKRADSIAEICCGRVILPHEAVRFISQEDIIIICLENGLQQEEVAEKLATAGLRKLIYLPMHIKQPLSVRRQYRENYAYLMSGGFEHIKGIPLFGWETVYTDYVIIKENHSKVTMWVGRDDVYTVEFKNMKFFSKIWDMNPDIWRQYADRKIEEVHPYFELFRYLKGEKNDLSFYMEMQGRKTKEQREELLNDRKSLYQVYEQAYKYEMNFFMDSPSKGIWNEKGYFNLQDGLHRAVYLLSKGHTEIPIVIARGDFEKYILSRAKKYGSY